MTEAHHFTFKPHLGMGPRPCGDCGLSYDAGDHIEINVLKPYTSYVCPSGGGLGHSSTWTGAYIHSSRGLRDHLCICGAEFIEEDNERWRLTFEIQHPGSDHWSPVDVTRSKHAAHSQHTGLLQLIEQGEPIRNVSLEQVAS